MPSHRQLRRFESLIGKLSIFHIMTGEQIARNVVVLFETNLAGTLKLWKAWDLLGRACNDVGELLAAVAPECSGGSAQTK